VIVIAHRLSTIRGADMICVFESGQIVERGTHQELVQSDGVYKTLISRQLTNQIYKKDTELKGDNASSLNDKEKGPDEDVEVAEM